MKNSITPQNNPFFRQIIAVAFCLFFFTCAVGIFSSCDTEYAGRWEQGNGTYTTNEKINDTTWTIEWVPFFYYTHPNRTGAVAPSDSKYEITHIAAEYSENEKSSKFYTQLAYYYGDSSVYVTHKYTISGVPLGDNWYKIEQTEVIHSGWDINYILQTRTIRYEEKFLFSYLSAID